MRIVFTTIVVIAVIGLVGVLAAFTAESVGGGRELAFLLGMMGGPIATFVGFAVYGGFGE